MIDGWENAGSAGWAAIGTSVPTRGCASRADWPLAVVARREGEVPGCREPVRGVRRV